MFAVVQIVKLSEQISYEEQRDLEKQLTDKQAALKADESQMETIREQEQELDQASEQLQQQAQQLVQQMEDLRQQVCAQMAIDDHQYHVTGVQESAISWPSKVRWYRATKVCYWAELQRLDMCGCLVLESVCCQCTTSQPLVCTLLMHPFLLFTGARLSL